MKTDIAGFGYCISRHTQSLLEWRETRERYWLESLKTWALCARGYVRHI